MKLHLLFPGQGSQHVGMGKFLYDNFPLAKTTFEEASDAISVDLKKMCFEGDEATLALTSNTQPALVTTSLATYRVLQSLREISPVSAAGHSVGEYAALATAGVLSLADAVRAVRYRGQCMQEAVPVGQGGMVAVMGLLPKEIEDLCRWAMAESRLAPVEPANFNSPDQTVISGRLSLLDWLRENFKPEVINTTKRVKFIPLKVSAPFHCSMMKPAEEKMRQFLSDVPFHHSKWAILQNVVAKPVTDAITLKENIIRQITGAVCWTQSLEVMKTLPSQTYLECGSGKVLTGLLKKSNADATGINMNTIEDLHAFEALEAP